MNPQESHFIKQDSASSKMAAYTMTDFTVLICTTPLGMDWLVMMTTPMSPLDPMNFLLEALLLLLRP